MERSFFKSFGRPFGARPLKLLFVAPEAAPFAQAGGLGSVMRSLPLALRELGQDVRVFIPRYGTIDPEKQDLELEIEDLRVPTGDRENPFLLSNVRKHSGGQNPPFYFLENREYYEKRANIYGYKDDHLRWALLCRGTLEFIKRSEWKPEIVVASDWQTGLLPNYLATLYKEAPSLSRLATFFIIHNLRYQGMRDFRFVEEEERDGGRGKVPGFFDPHLAELNWMLRGILWSDQVVTVSPTYAREIMTPEYGEGLHEVLKKREEKVHGVLNGIDYEHYQPSDSPHVPVHFSRKRPARKQRNKIPLQKKFGLPERKDVFMVGIVSRLARQKGFDLLKKIIGGLCQNLDLQMVFLGDGDSRYKEMIKQTAQKFPRKVGSRLEFSYSLPHLVYSASDVILLPSRFEPCGITQMEAMRYGCVPVARRTGGLADTVTDFGKNREEGNGFLFEDYDPLALFAALVRAKTFYENKRLWKKLVRRTMEQDFSWRNSAREYLSLFQKTRRKK